MAVVPRDEFRGGKTALQIFTRDAHTPIGLRARREQNLVIVLLSSASFTSLPNSTLPKKRKRGFAAMPSKTLVTCLIFK